MYDMIKFMPNMKFSNINSIILGAILVTQLVIAMDSNEFLKREHSFIKPYGGIFEALT
jgi:hypothetical protein